MTEYEFSLHNPITLDYVAELRSQDIFAKWTRRDIRAGSFEIIIPRNRVPLSSIAQHNVLLIYRDGVQEFAGVLEHRKIDATGRLWALSGPDLMHWWLRQRVVGAIDADPRSGVAETVVKAYVEANLGASAGAGRRATDYITVPWAIEANNTRGGTVSNKGLRKKLHQIVEEVCEAGDLLPSLSVNAGLDGYTFSVADPVDATAGTPFGVDWDNTESLVFDENYGEYENHLYILGDGTGDTRNVTEVVGDDETTHFRREGVVDARFAATVGDRQAVGDLEIARKVKALVSVAAVPLVSSQNAEYRTDWDVGWIVRFLEAELSDPIDIRIASATVALTQEKGESITFELGQYQMGSQLRRLSETIRQLRVASFE